MCHKRIHNVKGKRQKNNKDRKKYANRQSKQREKNYINKCIQNGKLRKIVEQVHLLKEKKRNPRENLDLYNITLNSQMMQGKGYGNKYSKRKGVV